MKTPRNQRTVTLKLKRTDVCSVIIALNTLSHMGGVGAFIGDIRDELIAQLHAFDEKLKARTENGTKVCIDRRNPHN